MTPTRDEWLATLTWRDDPPPTNDGKPPDNKWDLATMPGLVYQLNDEKYVIVGHINANGGECACCSMWPTRDDVVRWAELFSDPAGGNP